MQRILHVKIERPGGEGDLVKVRQIRVERRCGFGHRWGHWVERSRVARAEAEPCPFCNAVPAAAGGAA